MSDESALLAAILADPAEDTHRLVYADCIEEEQPERAEFIRLQIKMARCRMCHKKDGSERRDSFAANCGRCRPGRRRERELYEFADHWVVAELVGKVMWRWSRGFINYIHAIDWSDWSQHADAILAQQPIERVRLTTRPEVFGRTFEDLRQERWPGIEFELPFQWRINRGEADSTIPPLPASVLDGIVESNITIRGYLHTGPTMIRDPRGFIRPPG